MVIIRIQIMRFNWWSFQCTQTLRAYHARCESDKNGTVHHLVSWLSINQKTVVFQLFFYCLHIFPITSYISLYVQYPRTCNSFLYYFVINDFSLLRLFQIYLSASVTIIDWLRTLCIPINRNTCCDFLYERWTNISLAFKSYISNLNKDKKQKNKEKSIPLARCFISDMFI